MNSKFDIFIFDVYNWFYKTTFANSESLVTCGTDVYHTEGIIGFLNSIEYFVKTFGKGNDTQIYFLFDNAKTSIQRYRKSLSEDYKKTRVEQPLWFYQSLDMLELILKYYRDNSFMYRVRYLEADDYVGAILKKYVTDDKQVLLFSEDSDWFRSLSGNVKQYAKGKVYDKEMFFEENGYEATYSNILFYKTFYGDTADSIDGALKQFPKQFFLEVIKEFDTLNRFIFSVKNNTVPYLDAGWKLRIQQEEEKLFLNWNLVEAVDIKDADLDSFQVKCSFKENKLKIIYNSLNLAGKVDNRIKDTKTDLDEFNEMLSGMPVARK